MKSNLIKTMLLVVYLAAYHFLLVLSFFCSFLSFLNTASIDIKPLIIAIICFAASFFILLLVVKMLDPKRRIIFSGISELISVWVLIRWIKENSGPWFLKAPINELIPILVLSLMIVIPIIVNILFIVKNSKSL